jgi:hypothetical protein
VLAPLGLGLAIAAGPDHRRRRFGLLLTLLTLLYIAGVVIPHLDRFAYCDTAIMKQLAVFGPDPFTALKTMLLDPDLYWEHVSPAELRFLAHALLTVAGLCLASPYFYLAAPIFFYNFLYNNYASLHCAWHWALVAPLMYVAAVDALGKIMAADHLRRSRPVRWAGLALLLGVFIPAVTSFQERLEWQKGMYYREHNVNTKKIIAALAAIPPEASVSTMSRLLWFTAFRRQLSYNCNHPYPPDYVAILLPLHLGQNDKTDWCTIAAVEDHDSWLYQDYEIAAREGPLIIFRRRGRSTWAGH